MPSHAAAPFRPLTAPALAVLALAALALAAVPAPAATPEQVAREIEGLDEGPQGALPVPDPTAHATALGMLPAGGLLLIPESTNDRVMAFDPATGDLVDADFIPADPTNLSTPIQAILSASGDSILVSDQIDDVVQEYALDGTYIGVFAPAGGPNTAILDNIRGIALRPNGNLLVTVGGGANADAVAEFDTAGNSLGNFVANDSGGLASPFDVAEVVLTGGSLTQGEWLVAGINSDTIHHYDATGAPLPNFAPLNNFPEQVHQIPSGANAGNVLVADFSGTQEGVVELDDAGMLVGVYTPPGIDGNRGVFELPNGNILTTNGGGVHEIDRAGNLVETKISGVGARFITFVQGGAPVIGVSPSPIMQTLGEDETVVVPLTIDNAGDAPLDWTIDEAPASCAMPSDVPWLAVSPTAGTTDPMDSSAVDVTLDSTGLAPGTYDALLCVNSNDPQNPTVEVPVTLVVEAAVEVLEIPVLSGAGLLLLALLVAAAGAVALRRRG